VQWRKTGDIVLKIILPCFLPAKTMKKNYRLPAILCALAVCLALGFAVAAWNSPAGTPPAGNIATPINTGAAAQTKTGDLSLGGKLSVASDSASGRFCLDGECCATWEECATFAGACAAGYKITPMSDVSVAGYDKYRCTEDEYLLGFPIPFFTTEHDYWCPPDNCVMVSESRSYFFFLLLGTSTRRMCAESGYELFVDDDSQYSGTDACVLDGGTALSNFTAGLYVCNNGTWVKTSD